MTFYQAVNEIRKNNDGEFLYLNPHFCDDRDKLVLFCDIDKLRNLPDEFEILDSKLIDKSVNPNRKYEIRSLSILENIDYYSEYRVFPKFNSEARISNSIINIIEEIKKLNVYYVDGVPKNIRILYDEDRNTFVCDRELSSLKLPKDFIKLGNYLIQNGDNQYGFYYSKNLQITNYSSYIYPNVSINKECSNISDLANYIKLLNPNCKVGFRDNNIFTTLPINELVIPKDYIIDEDGNIKHGSDVFGKIAKFSEAELYEKQEKSEVLKTRANVFGEMNKAKKYKVYVLDASGNFIYENGKRKTREGTLEESIASLKKARDTLKAINIVKKEEATIESVENSQIMANAFFEGKRLKEANNSREYERIRDSITEKINSCSVEDKNRKKYELALSEFNKGYNFLEDKKTIERRKKHIIVKKEYTGKDRESILVGSSILYGAGNILFRQENPASFFEYVETEKFKKGKMEIKPGFLSRGCKNLMERFNTYINSFDDYDMEEVDISAYAR